MLGESFSRRTMGADAVAHVMGRFDEMIIAEATTRRTPLVGKQIRECGLRENLGVSVLGVWEQGVFQAARADTVIHDNTVLVLSGLQEHINHYNAVYLIYNVSVDPVLIIGGGRVGRATARAFEERGIEYRIVERLTGRVRNREKCVIGNAADRDVLTRAGVDTTPTVIITTHDDDMNVYLTVYCKRLRPDVQIIARASAERNVRTLHRAGADIVMSYGSMGATTILNMLKAGKTLLLAEGLYILRVPVPEELRGKTLAELRLREKTGCAVVAVRTAAGMEVTPDPHKPLPEAGELLLIGASQAEDLFLELYGRTAEQAVPGLDEVATAET
jgi:Trk K+ transport system NAD-binding subunit